ncbi:MAG: excinuclease ABC subunit C, partial [Mycoplasmataceae bacterium]|nr:excinuclease ABC subunit C [Mycoplasmataceae bacterium]
MKNVSELAGVYLWKDINHNILYVGKSKSLRKRMQQYFAGSINSFKTTKMVSKIFDYETIVCNNEREALILERNLIQKYKPFYNVCLLDDRKYPYINISLVKNILSINLKYVVKSESKYNFFYGPYINNGSSKVILNFLKRECLYNNGLPTKNNDIKFWEDKFVHAKKMLSKTNKSFISELTQKMYNASKNQWFEIANDLKKVIQFLSIQNESQVVELKDNENFDVIGSVEYDGYAFICVQFYRSGSLINSNINVININISIQDSTRQFVNQFYQNKQLPKKIITNLNIEIEDIYFDTKIINPKNGKQLLILNLSLENARQNMDFKILEHKRGEEIIHDGLDFLEKSISKNNLNHIIIIDNSNTKNINPVSVIISYRNGLPHKSEYRKFNIKIGNRRSDVEYIKQGLEQYFNNNANIPNLLIVDGGIQQLNEARNVINKLEMFELPIIGLVKNYKHQTDYVLLENGEKLFPTENQFLFLSRMQEEVDRFAKVTHRKKNLKNSLEGRLGNINGIG